MAAKADPQLSTALEGRLVGDVLVVGELPFELTRTGVRPAEMPRDAEELAAIRGDYDAVLVAGWGKDLGALDVVRALSRCVRPDGSLVLVVATARPGWRGARGAILGALRRRAPIQFEELCEAMLRCGLRDVVARELDDARALSFVAARVPERIAAGERPVRELISDAG